MLNSPDFQAFWGKVIDALACVFVYKRIHDDDMEYNLRSREFPEAIAKVRQAYYSCEPLPVGLFMVGDEIDEFFHELIMNPKYLSRIYDEAIHRYELASPPTTLQILLGEVKQAIALEGQTR